MNLQYLKEKRTKFSGIISLLLLFTAIVLLFMDFLTESKIDTFFAGAFVLVCSLIFSILGIVKGNTKSLGYTFCFPSIFLGGFFFIISGLAVLALKPDGKSAVKSDGHTLYNIQASNYLYQYEVKLVTGNTASSNDENPSLALYALCEAYDFFDDEKYKPDMALLMSLLYGFERTSKSDERIPFYQVEQYFQGCDDNLYEFYKLYENDWCDIISIKNQKYEEKYFMRYKESGYVKYLEDIFGGYEKVVAEQRMTGFEKDLAYAYLVFQLTDLDLNRKEEREMYIENSSLKEKAAALGYEWNQVLKDVEKEKKSKKNAEIILWEMMQKVFHRWSDTSDFSIALYSDALYSKYILNYL